MFDVVVSDRFAAWYDALPEAELEEVTLALDIAAELGARVDPIRGRPLLLWFDGIGPEWEWAMAGMERLQQWRQWVAYCFETPEFGRRLGELEPAEARQALGAVERVKDLLRGARVMQRLQGTSAAARALLSRRELWLDGLLASERERAWALEVARAGKPPEAPRLDTDPVRLALLEALRLVGLSADLIEPPCSGVRELELHVGVARLRLLLGVDAARGRIIAILGEALDRKYYGDSVKYAERYFRDYLEREAPSLPAFR